MAQQLYDMMLKYDTWALSIEREPISFFNGPYEHYHGRSNNRLKIKLEIDTGGKSGPTPYVRR